MENDKKSELEQWLEALCSDPFSSILDETVFRVDVFETETEYIVESELINCTKEQIFVTCENDALIIQVHENENINKQRVVHLPFPLLNKNIRAYFTSPILEIHISKEISANHPNRYMITIHEIDL
ncbi:alpha-crystallin domain-containing protein [Thermaerobacillus caldiproteolyticus]|uniref:heat-shock protein Hsp20 n=1 Tax=Thermaerobacillus caldiproteolyticus TaxID=247480 RepID=UPI00188C6AEA|nr:heat-shock protein Hsp20 [Anoxybacillus caldiproteolyticus]QPA32181.1 heat-shock protein Hsp20 [Anoxybacillus caldiproteolyticus]